MIGEIGGYIELEVPQLKPYFTPCAKVNSGRNGLRYIVRAYAVKEIWVPSYTCPVVWQALREEGCSLKFYGIDADFLPKIAFDDSDFILYTNYFGICNEKARYLSRTYENLILDNAQAFFAPPIGLGSANSARKFYGVSDGSYVFCKKKIEDILEKDTSYQRFSHLLKRADCGANFGYADFQANDDSLIGEPIKDMSNLTSKLLSSFDYESSKLKRLDNFSWLHRNLAQYNAINIEITDDIPMYYPFLCESTHIRRALIDNKVYVASCWKDMEKENTNEYELYLQKNLLPLIIDQRYDIPHMQKIIEIIHDNI